MTEQPRFTPPSGPVLGWVDGDVVRATGIPYATAGRFEAPRRIADSTVPRSATQPAPACPQPPSPHLERIVGSPTGGLPQHEDCHRLSITMPVDVDVDERLPVMVWVHGGSYVSGAGDAPLYDPRSLVVEQRVVAVTVTYRLGVLAFRDVDGEPANHALLDLLAAFAWLQRNVAAFGGDPARVTAYGQSAGGDAIAHLMAVPGAERLMARAIMQSAPFGLREGRARMTAAMIDAARRIPVDAPVEAVVAAQADVQAAANRSRSGLRAGMAFGMHDGTHPLPDGSGIEAAWDAVAPRIEVLVGRTAQEAMLFLQLVPPLRALRRVPVVGTAILHALERTLTRRVYGAPADAWLRRHRDAGGIGHRYVLSWSAPANPYGSAHAIDVPFLLGDRGTWEGVALLEGADWRELDAGAREVRRLWAAFARSDGLPSHGVIPGVLVHDRV